MELPLEAVLSERDFSLDRGRLCSFFLDYFSASRFLTGLFLSSRSLLRLYFLHV